MKEPVFSYDSSFLSYETIRNFLFPLKPDHPDVVSRLDLIAQYGPISNNHNIFTCFCKQCAEIVRKIRINLLDQKQIKKRGLLQL